MATRADFRVLQSRHVLACLGVMMVLATALPAQAQMSTGRVEIVAVDPSGAVLAGVRCELAGPQARSVATEADGVARFLNLPPGTYRVKASLQGFAEYVNPNVLVVAGGTVTLKAVFEVGNLQQQIEVTAATPSIDSRKTGTSTSVILDELRLIPTARDPWVVLQTVPGVIVDRVNVGGSESGQQSSYQAKGASPADSTWSIDGIPITDMYATGSTPAYYDFDMFQEITVTTGGAKLNRPTGGVALDFVLKAGTNTPRGSARIYFEDQAMQGTNIDPDLAIRLGSPNGKGNRMDRYVDLGAEWGGPIVKDRLWLWGSLARTDVRVLALTQALDRTVLDNGAVKASMRLREDLQASFLWFRGNKLKWGRDASPARRPETTLNQKGPSDVIKGEVNWSPRRHLYLTFRGAHVPTGFTSVPQGGMSTDVYADDAGVWHGSYWDYRSDRPQQVLTGEGTCFLGAHEVSFGVSWRRTTATTSTTLSSSRGNDVWSSHVGCPDMIAFVVSPWVTAARAFYTAGWIGDTFTVNRATINAGVRFDSQRDGVLATSEPAAPGFERWLPAISSPAVPGAITWNAVSPRLGVIYAIGRDRKTQARASYGIFASQLGNGTSSVISRAQYRYAAFYAVDRNGNRVADPSEIDTSVLAGWSGFDPANPGNVETPLNRIGKYSVPRTHEVILGLDRELPAGIGLSASFTWRRMGGFNWTPNIGVTSAMYTRVGTLTGGPLPDGANFAVPYYALLPASVPPEAAAGGVEYRAREGYAQRFWGVEVSATRRMSGRWMARVGFSTNDHREHIDRTTALTDPTPTLESPNIDGGVVVVAATGSGKAGIYQVLPAYQFLASGLYRGPWGLDISANMVLRQGFAQPWYRSQVATGDALANFKNVLLATDLARNRLPTVTTLDGRVARTFSLGRGVTMNLQADVFNLLNAWTPLRRQNDYRFTGANGFNQIQEIMNPLVVRIGASVAF